MAAEKKGYALKAERGERPFRYSPEHEAWRSATPGHRKDEADRAWRRRFGMWPRGRGAPGALAEAAE